ncbi:AraC family transcriptional regulator [bacterium]|nr:MAG: AraC family transcriptional regulator [bacterium]
MPRLNQPSVEPREEIDLLSFGREPLGARGEPLSFTMEQLLIWRAEHYREPRNERGEPTGEMLPLVVRREMYRGSGIDSYRHCNFWALYFVRRGRGAHVINGHAWSMARGNIYLLSPGSVHFYSGGADVVLDAVYFGETLFSPEEQAALSELSGAAPLIANLTENDGSSAADKDKRRGHFLHLSPQRQLEIEEIIAQIRDELARPEWALQLSAKSRLWCLIVQLALWRGESPPPTRGGESREFADVLQFCEANFSSALTVEQLADITHFSRNHFTRLFTQEVGMPPATFLRHLRLQHAQKLLRETMHSANDIGRLSGFSDATAFARAFQKGFGVSPSAYRKANKSTSKARTPLSKFQK